MKSIETELLESLGAGVHLLDAHHVATPTSGADFGSLLGDALNGKPKTDLGVRFGPAVSGMFGIDEQKKIAHGIDQAAAGGVDHALILHDQRTLRVDVRNRVVLDVYKLSDHEVIDGIDGFVSLQTSENKEDPADIDTSDTGGFRPARIVRNASLVHALAGRVPDRTL